MALLLGLAGLAACAPRSVIGTWGYHEVYGGGHGWRTATLTLRADSTYIYDGDTGDIAYTFGSTGTWRRVAPNRLLITSDWPLMVPPSELLPLLGDNDFVDRYRHLLEINVPVWYLYEPFQDYPIRVRPGVLIFGQYRSANAHRLRREK